MPPILNAPRRPEPGARRSGPPRVIRFEIAPTTILLILLVIAGVWIVVRLLPILVVMIAAFMIVGSLNPVVAWLEARRFSRGLAIGIVFGTAVGLTALGLFLVIPPLIEQVQSLIEHEPEIRGHVVALLDGSPLTSALADQLREVKYDDLFKQSRGMLLTLTTRAFAIVAYSFAAVFLALYVMIDRDRLRGALFSVVPRRHHIRFSRVLLNLESIVGGYIRGQVLTCVLMGVFILGVLLICRVPNALAIAVFGGVADVLPYIGVFLTMAPAVAAAYAQSPAIAVTVFVLLLLYEEFESRVLVPVVYGRALRLPSSVVFFSLLVGGSLAGIVGALLALPMAAAVLMLIEELRVELPGETIQPEDVEIRRKDEKEEQEYKARTNAAPAEEASAIAVEIARERKEEEAAVEAEQTEPAKPDKNGTAE
jgi:putative heme transporter